MKSNITKIIMIRHGETSIDKLNPKRRLTRKGIVSVKLLSKKLRKIISINNTVMMSADNIRSVQTADIISRELGIVFDKKYTNITPSFQIINWGSVFNRSLLFNNLKDKNLTEIYFRLYKLNKLPRNVKSPYIVGKCFINFIQNISSDKNVLIFVGNGGTLEAASYYQTLFKPLENDKLNFRVLNYCDYFVLKKV